MADVAADLLRMKRQIEETREKKARLEGKLSSLTERLLKEFDCKDIESATALQKTLSTEVAEKEKLLDRKVKEMREQYGL